MNPLFMQAAANYFNNNVQVIPPDQKVYVYCVVLEDGNHIWGHVFFDDELLGAEQIRHNIECLVEERKGTPYAQPCEWASIIFQRTENEEAR